MDLEYGRSDAVSPLIRRVTANNPGPFTFRGTGTYIVGHGTVVVIDPGPDLPEHLEAIQAAVAGERVSHILVTHHHLDHSPLGRAALPDHGRAGVRPGGGERDSRGRDAARSRLRQLPARHSYPGRRGGLRPRLDGRGDPDARPHLEPHLLCPGGGERPLQRGPHHGLVHHGDHAAGRRHDRLPCQPRADQGARLHDAVADPRPTDRRGDTVHRRLYRAPSQDRERQILDRLGAGDRTIAQMVPNAYAAVDQRLWPAAARSMHAAVIALVRAGRVACEGQPELGSEYRLA